MVKAKTSSKKNVTKPKKKLGKFVFKKEKHIEKPKKSDFVSTKINWKIPWLEDLINPKNKFDDPKKSDFVEAKKKTRLVGEPVLHASAIIGKETKTIFEEEPKPFEKYVEPKEINPKRDWLATINLLLVGIAYILFIALLLGQFFGISASDYASINGLFYALVIISILLSLAFSVKKDTTMGFLFVGIILIVYLGLSMILASNIFDIIGLLLILLAILPIEVYNIYYNSKK